MKLSDKNIQNFWNKVCVEDANECWLWTGTTDGKYGVFNVNYKMEKAHRVSWVIHFGEIPKGLLVLHKCDNPPCVNPHHLFLGTLSDNTRDSIDKGRFGHCYRSIPTKLTKLQVKDIRQLHTSSSLTQSEIADRYNVSQSYISKIIRREKWKNI